MTKVGVEIFLFNRLRAAQLTFRSQKWLKKEKKKPHASLDFSKSTKEKQVSN